MQVNHGEQVSGNRYTETSTTDNRGTTVKTASQNLGEPVREEEHRYDSRGHELADGSGGSNRRIEDVSASEDQKERDRLYEERIEDEYAKREGGA